MEKLVGKRNAGFIKTHQLLVNSYIIISQKKHYSQITVTELCNHAKVNRVTFYKHFKGTWEIKEFIEARLVNSINKLHEEFKGVDLINDSFKVFKYINNIIAEKNAGFLAIYQMKGSGVFTKAIIDRVNYFYEEDYRNKYNSVSPDNKRIKVAYFIGGAVYAYHDWLEGKIKCSLDELATYLSNCAKNIPYFTSD